MPPCMQERELISLESDNSGPAAIWILRRGRGDCERLILPPCTRAALGSGVRWWRAEPTRGDSRVKSSTIVSARNFRPSRSASLTKSMLQRSLRRVGTGIGTRRMAMRFRRRRRTLRPSSRYTRWTSLRLTTSPSRRSSRYNRR